MTAPVDPRPYAGPADLVTAADVAEWLDTLHKGPPDERIFGVQDAVAALDERLDRERRQACRRGALACWRRFACVARSWGERPLTRAAMRDCAWSPEWPFPAARVLAAQAMIQDLTRALAFRAAARQP